MKEVKIDINTLKDNVNFLRKYFNDRLNSDFNIGETPITQKQFHELMGYNPSFNKCDDCPVENLTWNEAAAFCNALSRKHGLEEYFEEKHSGKNIECEVKPEFDGKDYSKCNGYRFPTETEWRFVTSFEVNTKADILKMAWAKENSKGKTHKVGSKEPCERGIYDIFGNVWEYTLDMYCIQWRKASGRVVLGGSWNYSSEGCRSLGRIVDSKQYRSSEIGFRVARTVK